MDISRNSLTMGKALKRQITKYINECRTRESGLNSVKASLKIIRKPDPPPVPAPDYKGSDAEDSPYDEGWNTDFDDDTDEEDDCNPVADSNRIETAMPCQQNSASSKETWTSGAQKANVGIGWTSESQTSMPKSCSSTVRKPPLPRPPALEVTPIRNDFSPSSVTRPDAHPPLPPSVTTEISISPDKSTEENGVQDDYEVPSPSVSEAGSACGSAEFQTPTGKRCISLSGGSMFKNENASSPTDYSEKPALPPKNVSPPPLPEKPKPKVEMPLLPRKASDDPSSKSKKKQLMECKRTLTNLIYKKKDSTFANFTKPRHSDSDGSKPLNGKITKSVSLGSLQQAVKESSGGGYRPLPPVPPSKAKSSRASMATLNFHLQPLQLAAPQHPLALHAWFHQVEREEAEATLKQLGKSGSYLVRESKRAGEFNPYTLTILYDGRISHLNIRQKIDGVFALGREKENEKTFTSVEELITYHQTEPIVLTSKGQQIGKTLLCCHP